MPEHLGNAERAVMTSAVLALCDYTCEWADDATLFALMAVVAQYAAQAAARLDQQRYMCPPPSDMALAQGRVQVVGTPALTNEVNSILMPAPGRPG